MVSMVVVAPDHRWAESFMREQGLQPRDVVVVTPGLGYRVRGLRGVPVVWVGPARLTDDDLAALRVLETTPG